MNNTIDGIKEEYLNNIVRTIPLHKAIILFFFILLFFDSLTHPFNSFWLKLINSKINFYFDLSSGFSSHLLVKHIILAILATYFNSIIYNKLKAKLFSFFSTYKDFKKIVKDLTETYKEELTESENLNFHLGKDIEKKLMVRSNILKIKFSISEVLFALSILSFTYCFFIFMFWDLALGILFLIIVLIMEFKSFIYYVSEILPYMVAERVFHGQEVNFGSVPTKQ